LGVSFPFLDLRSQISFTSVAMQKQNTQENTTIETESVQEYGREG